MQLQVMSNQMNGARWTRYMQSEKRALAEIELNRRVLRGEPVKDFDEDDWVDGLELDSEWQDTELTAPQAEQATGRSPTEDQAEWHRRRIAYERRKAF